METSEMMREIRAQWAEMQDRVEKMTKDCKHFGRSMP